MAQMHTFQNQKTISLHREDFKRFIVLNQSLDKTDLRVVLHLFTFLDNNEYKYVDVNAMSKDLGIKKGKIRDSINYLIDEEILDYGSSGHVKNGLRFTF